MGVKYYTVHMYNMPYYAYTYGSTADSLFLGPTALIIESVDSINRDERGFPLTQYITNWGISRAG